MSGHSKWSKVKHQKATTDVLKAVAFTRATRGITIAVKDGGGVTDPNTNFHLRLAIEKARSVNMPKENIERAIDKAKGVGGENIHQIVYEAYGPFGVALYIEAATNNINRTVSFLKQVLEHAGGSMGSPGTVSHLFNHRGVILVSKEMPYDTILTYALEFGADDVIEKEDVFEMYTKPDQLFAVKTNLEEKNVRVDSFSLVMEAKAVITLSSDHQERIDALIERIEESDDIQRVYTNI
jgi:YebC/PmpR family DNA-binding regulatory protein